MCQAQGRCLGSLPPAWLSRCLLTRELSAAEPSTEPVSDAAPRRGAAAAHGAAAPTSPTATGGVPTPTCVQARCGSSDGAGGRCQCMPVSVWRRCPPAVRGEASSEGTLSRARMIHNRRYRNGGALAWGRCTGPGFKPRLEVGRAWPMAHWRCHAACCPGRSASLCAAVGQLARR